MSNAILALSLLLPVAAFRTVWRLFLRHRGERTPPRTALLVNVLAIAGLGSLAFAAGEIYYRFLFDATDSFSMSLVSRRWFERHFHENSTGFRDKVDYPPAPAAGRPRVTFFGDSFTAGHGIGDVDRRFVNLLRQGHPEWEVHALAKPGWDTGHLTRATARAFGQGYRVQGVVLVYCMNDITDLIPEWREAYVSMAEDFVPRDVLTGYSYLANTLFFRLKARRRPEFLDYFRHVEEAYGDDRWETQKERLTAFRDTIEEAGGHLAVVTFPFMHNLGPDYPYREVHTRLHAFWAGIGVPHLDLLPVFEEAGGAEHLTLNPYDAHPNALAHRLAAESIEPLLAALVEDYGSDAPDP